MKKLLLPAVFLPFLLIFLAFFSHPVSAFTITNDPQYIVMNFSTINDLDWGVDETTWQTKIKPQILEQIDELKAALPPGTNQRQLAWSTLEEYMNTPLDTPSENSYYAIKIRRILEVTEEENLPVFLPLNGFQWWDEMPELYNWWDSDGTHTSQIFFDRLSQKDPDFKERFIKGYDPNNIWNVEWQDATTPMNLNWRNWGGGGFRLAPPPNLVQQYRSKLSYREVQQQRLKIILGELVKKLSQWQSEGKSNLFAGITIGTEISLNASVLPKDEFQPYGYRGVQDTLCGDTNGTATATCAAQLQLTPAQLQNLRQQVVQNYLDDLTRMAVNMGIPKQRIYTHVWSEAQPGDPRYTNYAAAAFTYYSRAGLSLYGFAGHPFDLTDWKNAVLTNGSQAWGAVEYSASPKTKTVWVDALHSVLDSPIDPAKVVTIYNWAEHKDTGAIAGMKHILNEEPTPPSCNLPEILPTTDSYAENPAKLQWNYLFENPSSTVSATLPADFSLQLHFQPGIRVTPPALPDINTPLPTQTSQPNQAITQAITNPQQSTQTDFQLPDGIYTWYIEADGCENKRQFSEPRILTISKSGTENQ